jgi:hypothetical protein
MGFVAGGKEVSVYGRHGALQDGFEKILEAGLTASKPEMQIDAGLPVYP